MKTEKQTKTADGAARGRVVLVGTYRGDQLKDWPGWYCWPLDKEQCCQCENVASAQSQLPIKAMGKLETGNIGNCNTSTLATLHSVTELWLFRGTADERRYRALFIGVKTREELIRDYGYPGGDVSATKNAKIAKGGSRLSRPPKPHGSHYALFKTELLYRHRNDLPGEADAVIVRLMDFVRSPKVRKQLREYLQSPDRNDPDLAKLLPSVVTKVPLERLRVCEAAVQMTLWDEPQTPIPSSSAKTVGFGPIVDSTARKKRSLGQFFTEGDSWLLPQIEDFIKSSGASEVYDPFAGSGCLLQTIENRIGGFSRYVGLDVDPTLSWERNDSLRNIPSRPNAIIVTNPPYLSNYSAARKKLDKSTLAYFDSTEYDDLYLLALDKMIAAQDWVVAIIPETFVNSPYRRKDRLQSITILQSNPFNDTETPVVVACFDSKSKSFDQIKVFKDADFVSTLQKVEDSRIHPSNNVRIQFNDPNGWLGVRCVDTTDPADTLHFDYKENIDYDWDAGIKVSSRLLTLLSVDIPVDVRSQFILSCNNILASLRQTSADVIFSPFKGNMKNGTRRRRLDFATCRAIVERAYAKTMPSADLFAWK